MFLLFLSVIRQVSGYRIQGHNLLSSITEVSSKWNYNSYSFTSLIYSHLSSALIATLKHHLPTVIAISMKESRPAVKVLAQA
jgi:hypothetical protein